MKAKEYLSQALWLNQRIDNKLEQLERLKAMAMRVTANLTQEKVSGGYNSDGKHHCQDYGFGEGS
jgi:hypothetical protein